MAKLLTHLLIKDVPFDFIKECSSAILRLKVALIIVSVIQAPDCRLPFEVMCDASDFSLEAVLGLRKKNKPYAIHCTSRTLDAAQVNDA